jgi:hypothetical protein
MGRESSRGRHDSSTKAQQFGRLSDLARHVLSATAKLEQAAAAARAQSFFEWARTGGFLADRERLDFERWGYLPPVYEAVPEDPSGLDLVVMKAAQAGASTMSMLFTLWVALRTRSQLGYFLPTADLAHTFSTTRFLKMVRDNPMIHAAMGDPDSPRARRMTDEGSASTRRLLQSVIYFTYPGGRVTTEALPLDGLVFDEVQGMSLLDIERAEERISASVLRALVRVSTPTFPGSDIHHFFLGSDQREFHTRCGCADGVVLADQWHPTGPLCIDRGNGATPGVPNTPFWFCPYCKTIIRNPQDGAYRAHNPSASRVGFHFPQLLSPRWNAAKILAKWENHISTQTFYSRVLGRPWADPTTMPITLEHLEAAQDPNLRWGPPERNMTDAVYMGIDQMGGENYVVIKGRQGDRMILVHIEMIRSDDPWRRCAELMRRYDVMVAVVEALPNFNEAHRFARAHHGRVFVATYQEHQDELVLWGDRVRDPQAVRYSADDIRSPWTVSVDQYKMMSWSLARWANGEIHTPDARALPICRDVFWLHLQRVALVTEPREGREDERRYRTAVRKVGIDPHFAYANMLCDVAWVREGPRVEIWFPPEIDSPAERPRDPYREQIMAAFPELGIEYDPDLCCRTCVNFAPEKRLCRYRDLLVEPHQPMCDAYIPADVATVPR